MKILNFFQYLKLPFSRVCWIKTKAIHASQIAESHFCAVISVEEKCLPELFSS